MTSNAGFLLIAACALVLHVSLSTEILATLGYDPPRRVRWLARTRRYRRSLLFVSVPLLIATQLLVGTAIVQPDRIAGTFGQLVAAGELVLSILWLAALDRWRRAAAMRQRDAHVRSEQQHGPLEK